MGERVIQTWEDLEPDEQDGLQRCLSLGQRRSGNGLDSQSIAKELAERINYSRPKGRGF